MHFECELDFVHMLPGTLALGLLAHEEAEQRKRSDAA